MRSRRLIAFALTAVCVPVTASAQIPARTRVLVMPFAVQADAPAATAALPAWLGEAAAILVADDLAALGLAPLSREERVAAFDRLQLAPTTPLTRATTIRAAELMGVAWIVVGELRAGASLTARARVIQVQAARQLADVEEQAAPADLMGLADRLAAGLARAVPDACRADACTKLPAHPAPDLFENYVKGLLARSPAVRQRFLEAALRQAPRDARVLMALWAVYAEQGAQAKALTTARAVPADSPLWRRAQFAAALTLVELGRIDEAVRNLRALEAERSSPVLNNALGVMELRRRQPGAAERAIPYFRRAVETSAEDADFLFNLGYAHALAHDNAAALGWLREAVRFDATDGDAHALMSALLESEGKTAEAQRELELASQLGARGVPGAGASRGKVADGLERLRTELDAFVPASAAVRRPADKDHEDVALFYLGEGRRLAAAGRDREAIDELRRAVYLSPYHDEPHLLLGRIYERAGRLPDAIDEFKVALWCRETEEGHLALGGVLLAAGDKSGARAQAERVLGMNPSSAEARALLDRTNRQARRLR